MKFRRGDKGFTLVELMVVVLIIGILVAIAIPVFNVARARAQQRSCHANMRTLEGSAQAWLADAVGNDLATLNGSGWEAELVPNFVTEVPTCPNAGESYLFNATGQVDATTTTCPHPHF